MGSLDLSKKYVPRKQIFVAVLSLAAIPIVHVKIDSSSHTLKFGYVTQAKFKITPATNVTGPTPFCNNFPHLNFGLKNAFPEIFLKGWRMLGMALGKRWATMRDPQPQGVLVKREVIEELSQGVTNPEHVWHL